MTDDITGIDVVIECKRYNCCGDLDAPRDVHLGVHLNYHRAWG